MGMVAVGSDLCRAAPPKEALRATATTSVKSPSVALTSKKLPKMATTKFKSAAQIY